MDNPFGKVEVLKRNNDSIHGDVVENKKINDTWNKENIQIFLPVQIPQSFFGPCRIRNHSAHPFPPQYICLEKTQHSEIIDKQIRFFDSHFSAYSDAPKKAEWKT
jgi:hypothetical protein